MKPILFNTEMVQAIMDGRKTATRRVIKTQPMEGCIIRQSVERPYAGEWHLYKDDPILNPSANSPWGLQIAPPVEQGDILYVRETWQRLNNGGYIFRADKDRRGSAAYYNEYAKICGGWRPSIHMPKEAARLFLRVTDVWAERLQEITPHGAKAEGADAAYSRVCGNGEAGNICDFSVEAFESIWDGTIKPADRASFGWVANPWVWVILFDRCEKPDESGS